MNKMTTQEKIMAGKPGTKKWIKKYGKDFVCIRYKYDHENKRKIKTVELIVEETAWEKDNKRMPYNKKVGIRIRFGEKNLGIIVRSAGGIWDKKRKIWILPYGQVKALGIENRIVIKNVDI